MTSLGLNVLGRRQFVDYSSNDDCFFFRQSVRKSASSPWIEFCPVLSSVLRGVNDVCECAMVSYPELNAAVVVDLSLHTGLRGNLK